MPYQLVHRSGVDTLHQQHPWEVCNVDDAEDREEVDDETAAALMAIGSARACAHCQPFAEPS